MDRRLDDGAERPCGGAALGRRRCGGGELRTPEEPPAGDQGRRPFLSGQSNVPDSLLIRTRDLDRVELHDAFVPAGCAGRSLPQTLFTGPDALDTAIRDVLTATPGQGSYVCRRMP